MLIERGSEVGGDDVRTDVGTVARIVEAAELPDGRWALAAVGRAAAPGARAGCPTIPTRSPRWRTGPTRRPGPATPRPLADVHRAAAARASAWPRRPATPRAPATIELADDPVLAATRRSRSRRSGPLDQQRLLAADSPDARVAQLADLLRDAIEVLELRLGGSGDG